MSVADFQQMTYTTLEMANLKPKTEYLDSWDVETDDEKFAAYILNIAKNLEYNDKLSIMKLIIFHKYIHDKYSNYNNCDNEYTCDTKFDQYINRYIQTNNVSIQLHDMEDNIEHFVIILNYMKQCFGKNYERVVNKKWYGFNYNSYQTTVLTNNDLMFFLDIVTSGVMDLNIMSEKISVYVDKYDIYDDVYCEEMLHYANLLDTLKNYYDDPDSYIYEDDSDDDMIITTGYDSDNSEIIEEQSDDSANTSESESE